MNSYLITYEYDTKEPTRFTTIVEGNTYKDAEKTFKENYIPATILDIKVLDVYSPEIIPRDRYPKIVDMRFIINNDHNVMELEKKIADATGLKIGLDPLGRSECFEVMAVEPRHGED